MEKVLKYANWFIKKGIEANSPIDQMKVQKLLYFAYGWYLKLTGKKLFEQRFEAWMYGPVVNELYHYLKIYGSSKIDTPLPSSQAIEEELEDFFESVWSTYGDMSAVDLMKLTHEKKSPWAKAYIPGIWINNYIKDEDIKESFKNI